MRILEARASLAKLRFARTVRTARGDFDERRSVIFSVEDTSGLTGYGEAAPWPGFGPESGGDARAARADAARLLDGLDIDPGDWPVAPAPSK